MSAGSNEDPDEAPSEPLKFDLPDRSGGDYYLSLAASGPRGRLRALAAAQAFITAARDSTGETERISPQGE